MSHRALDIPANWLIGEVSEQGPDDTNENAQNDDNDKQRFNYENGQFIKLHVRPLWFAKSKLDKYHQPVYFIFFEPSVNTDYA